MTGSTRITEDTLLSLKQVADLLRVHQRTVQRRMREGQNRSNFPVYEVADTFRVRADKLVLVLRGSDILMMAKEAAEHLGLTYQTFWQRRYPATIHNGDVIRYSRQDLMNWNAQRWQKDRKVV